MKHREIYLLAVTVFLTILAWVLLDLKNINENTPTDSQIDSFSLKYNIDIGILDKLQLKRP